jgi:hypothetical protein
VSRRGQWFKVVVQYDVNVAQVRLPGDRSTVQLNGEHVHSVSACWR